MDLSWIKDAFKTSSSVLEKSEALAKLDALLSSDCKTSHPAIPEIVISISQAFMHDVQSWSRGGQESRALTGLSPVSAIENRGSCESMHLSCSALQLISQHVPAAFCAFLHDVIPQLCESAPYVPSIVAFSIEKIISNLSSQYPLKCTELLVMLMANSEAAYDTRLLCLRLVSDSISNLTSLDDYNEYVGLLPGIAKSLLTFLTSSLEMRRYTISALVEIHHIYGDDLFDFISDMTPAHMKLLHIYIEKKRGSSFQIV